MNKKNEAHLFIIWKNARYKQDSILKEIAEKLRIVEVFEVEWSEHYYSSNLTRFYGQKLPDRSFKEKHCGKGPFLLVICEDQNPLYNDRDTISRDIEKVNSNIFDLKQKFRNQTGGGHKIHATNNPIETNHDLTLLLGCNLEDYCVEEKADWNKSIKKLERDLTGFNGWSSAEQLFYTLNACEKYVVMRNFDELPQQLTLQGHDDIDFLVENYNNFAYLLNGEKVFDKKYRVHYRINVDNKDILCDIRFVGDNYYDINWQNEIINNRLKFNGFYIPNNEEHRYSVLYHALIHKQEIAEDYLLKLNEWFGTSDLISLNERLISYMVKNSYLFTEPYDLSVYYNFTQSSIKRVVFYKYLNIKSKLYNFIYDK